MISVWPEHMIRSVYPSTEGGVIEFLTQNVGDGYYVSEVNIWDHIDDPECRTFTHDENVYFSWEKALIGHGKLLLDVLAPLGFIN